MIRAHWNELHRPHIVPQFIQRAHVRWQRRRVRPAESIKLEGGNLYVDISVLAKKDAGTGIQRLVRAHLDRLLRNPPDDMKVWPVMATRRHFYTHVEWDGTGPARETGVIVCAGPGDRFLGLDLSAHIIPRHMNRLRAWKRAGVSFNFVIYDLFPLQNPDWFSGKLVAAFRRWIVSIAMLADGVTCISRFVEREFAQFIATRFGITDIQTCLLPIDVSDWLKRDAAIGRVEDLPTALRGRTFLLSVGTVEPRKGYAPLLDAFEQLWSEGMDLALVIVGRPGWRTSALQHRLLEHPEAGRYLFWERSAGDCRLNSYYSFCRGIVLPSLAEGLGLPVQEGLNIGKPVLARELEVYKELDPSSGVLRFFPADAGTFELATAIRCFVEDLPSRQRKTAALT